MASTKTDDAPAVDAAVDAADASTLMLTVRSSDTLDNQSNEVMIAPNDNKNSFLSGTGNLSWDWQKMWSPLIQKNKNNPYITQYYNNKFSLFFRRSKVVLLLWCLKVKNRGILPHASYLHF